MTEPNAREPQLTLRGVPIGRLIEPDDPSEQAGYGFELMLPPGSGASTSSGAARVVAATLAAHGEGRSYERSP